MQQERYEISINGNELSNCLDQLKALEDSPRGLVKLHFFDEKILIQRLINKNNQAAVNLAATGDCPFPLTVRWSIFNRLSLKTHTSKITLRLIINSIEKESILTIDGMHLPLAEIPTQFNLLTLDSIPIQKAIDNSKNPILNRIHQIDVENEKSGVRSKEITSVIYERDQELNRLIKTHRGSACQICGYYFITTKEEHYTECHHLEHLADDGLDCSKNILVVCANHHRQLHFGKYKILNHTFNSISIEIDGAIYNCKL